MKKVLVAGTFDFLHPGHLNFISQARAHGDYLVAVVARDETVEKIKGTKPYFNELERFSLIGALKGVDKAVLGNEGDLFTIVKKLKPDVIVLGYDQWPGEKLLRSKLDENGLSKTKIFRAKEKNPAKYKSSKIRKFMANG